MTTPTAATAATATITTTTAAAKGGKLEERSSDLSLTPLNFTRKLSGIPDLSGTKEATKEAKGIMPPKATLNPPSSNRQLVPPSVMEARKQLETALLLALYADLNDYCDEQESSSSLAPEKIESIKQALHHSLSATDTTGTTFDTNHFPKCSSKHPRPHLLFDRSQSEPTTTAAASSPTSVAQRTASSSSSSNNNNKYNNAEHIDACVCDYVIPSSKSFSDEENMIAGTHMASIERLCSLANTDHHHHHHHHHHCDGSGDGGCNKLDQHHQAGIKTLKIAVSPSTYPTHNPNSNPTHEMHFNSTTDNSSNGSGDDARRLNQSPVLSVSSSSLSSLSKTIISREKPIAVAVTKLLIAPKRFFAKLFSSSTSSARKERYYRYRGSNSVHQTKILPTTLMSDSNLNHNSSLKNLSSSSRLLVKNLSEKIGKEMTRLSLTNNQLSPLLTKMF
jgi:hypothetical protein